MNNEHGRGQVANQIGRRSATVDHVAFRSGRGRILSFQRLADLPLTVVVSIARDVALADFTASLRWYALAGLLVLIAIVALTTTLIVHFRRLQHSQAALAAKEAVLSATLAALPDGVRVVDRDLRLIAWNDQLFRVLGVARDAILDTPDPTLAPGALAPLSVRP